MQLFFFCEAIPLCWNWPPFQTCGSSFHRCTRSKQEAALQRSSAQLCRSWARPCSPEFQNTATTRWKTCPTHSPGRRCTCEYWSCCSRDVGRDGKENWTLFHDSALGLPKWVPQCLRERVGSMFSSRWHCPCACFVNPLPMWDYPKQLRVLVQQEIRHLTILQGGGQTREQPTINFGTLWESGRTPMYLLQENLLPSCQSNRVSTGYDKPERRWMKPLGFWIPTAYLYIHWLSGVFPCPCTLPRKSE